MTISIPKTSDLAAALVANAGVTSENAETLAGIIVDEARRANAAGLTKTMLDHVEDARKTFPLWFGRTQSTHTASASTPPKSLTERISRGETPSFDEISDAIRRLRRSNQT